MKTKTATILSVLLLASCETLPPPNPAAISAAFGAAAIGMQNSQARQELEDRRYDNAQDRHLRFLEEQNRGAEARTRMMMQGQSDYRQRTLDSYMAPGSYANPFNVRIIR